MGIELRIRVENPGASHSRILKKIGEVMRQTLPGAAVELIEDSEPEPSAWNSTTSEIVEAGATDPVESAPVLPMASDLNLSDLPPIRTNEETWNGELLKNRIFVHSAIYVLSVIGMLVIARAVAKEPPVPVLFIGALFLHAGCHFLGLIRWIEKKSLEIRIRQSTCPSCHVAFALEEVSVLVSERQIMKRRGDRMEVYNEETKQKVTYCKNCDYRTHGRTYKTGSFE